jgi:hypothetical protein
LLSLVSPYPDDLNDLAVEGASQRFVRRKNPLLQGAPAPAAAVTQELPFNFNQRRIPDLSPERARIVRSAGNRLAGALHIGH